MTKRRTTRNTEQDWQPFTTDPAHCIYLDDEKNTVTIAIYRKKDRKYKYVYPTLALNQDNFNFCLKLALDLNKESKKVDW